jgi:hypothetical protein
MSRGDPIQLDRLKGAFGELGPKVLDTETVPQGFAASARDGKIPGNRKPRPPESARAGTEAFPPHWTISLTDQSVWVEKNCMIDIGGVVVKE